MLINPSTSIADDKNFMRIIALVYVCLLVYHHCTKYGKTNQQSSLKERIDRWIDGSIERLIVMNCMGSFQGPTAYRVVPDRSVHSESESKRNEPHCIQNAYTTMS